MYLQSITKVAIAAISLVAFFSAACTTTQATIRTTPPGAKVYLRGKYLGRTPVQVKLNNGWLDESQYRVSIKHEGHKPVKVKLDQEIQAGNIVGDLFLGFVTLGYGWYLGILNGKTHSAEYSFLLEETGPTAGTEKQQ